MVLDLPRGGVPVAVRIAEALYAPLDLMLVRKIDVPGHRELAVGAIAGSDGHTMVTNPDVAAMAQLDARAIEQLADVERAELRRRQALYLKGRPPLDLAGKTVILVDDGIATGATAKTALQAQSGSCLRFLWRRPRRSRRCSPWRTKSSALPSHRCFALSVLITSTFHKSRMQR